MITNILQSSRASYHPVQHFNTHMYVLQLTLTCYILYSDIDECSSSPCGHQCTNTIGSFQCTCNTGYTLDSNGRDCTGLLMSLIWHCARALLVDIDECESSPCDHLCTNTPGSFECSCRSGFSLDRNRMSCNG